MKRIVIGHFDLNVSNALDFNKYKYYEFILSYSNNLYLIGSRGIIFEDTLSTSSIGYNDLGNTIALNARIQNNTLIVVTQTHIQNFQYTLIGYTF